jgi:hypothetical protein
MVMDGLLLLARWDNFMVILLMDVPFATMQARVRPCRSDRLSVLHG